MFIHIEYLYSTVVSKYPVITRGNISQNIEMKKQFENLTLG